jgi:hypothetical protein
LTINFKAVVEKFMFEVARALFVMCAMANAIARAILDKISKLKWEIHFMMWDRKLKLSGGRQLRFPLTY